MISGAAWAQTAVPAAPPATAETTFGNVSASSSETDFGLTAGGGYRRGDLDIRIALSILNMSHAGDSMTIGANVGYSFWGQ